MRWLGQHAVARDLSDKAHHFDVFHHNMREFNCMFHGKKKKGGTGTWPLAWPMYASAHNLPPWKEEHKRVEKMA
jgi:hypothetical protein